MTSTSRYEILEQIGAGGTGIVYRAFDRRRREEVAVKRLHVSAPDALYRFKQEFRSLAGMAHPNLVVLHGLEEMGGALSILMELVRGVDFLTHVRPGRARRDPTLATLAEAPSPEIAAHSAQAVTEGPRAGAEPLGAEGEARLRAALRQLAEGIAALHAAGKLHCDIKPHNVLVTPEGRVVVLDFGLVTELVPRSYDRSAAREISGTAAYMAPEQLRPMPLVPATDWYAFGVLLYEALTGRLPFEGSTASVLRAKQRQDPVPPRRLAPDAPEDLCDLCVELLRRSPAERPEAPEIFAWLGIDGGPSSAIAPARRGAFVGRSKEIAALGEMLEAARRGRPAAVFVHGASGIGKTALVRRFLEKITAGTDAVVLEGRCHEHESVPYKALDGVVDSLSQHLVRLRPEVAAALLPEDAHLLGQAFPVLMRAPGIAASAGVAAAGPDRKELRRRVFSALRELFVRLAARAPLVLFIDDIQWGDADSAALLVELLSPPSPPPALLVACARSEDLDRAAPVQLLLSQWTEGSGGPDVHRLCVAPLAEDEARDLAQSLLGAAEAAPGLVDAITSESGGNPFFAEELAAHARLHAPAHPREPGAPAIVLEDVLRARVALLGPDERRLLSVLCVAGHPVPESAADRAAAPLQSGRLSLARLASAHLVSRRGPDPSGPLEPHHDRIRKAVASGIAPEVARAHHLALAEALAEVEGIDPEIVAEHFREGGSKEQAARYHVVAAERAAAALAFSRAASLYRAALESGAAPGEPWRLRAKMAEALANSGKGREAAESFAAAGREAESSAARELVGLDLRRRAAEHHLRSGHVDEGLALLREVLSHAGAGYPITTTGALISLVKLRARLRLRGLGFTLRDPGQISPRERMKVETYWSAGLGLSMVDSLRAAYFQACHEIAALEMGEPVNVARGLSSHVAALGSEGGEANRRRCAEVLEEAESLARRIDDPSILMLTHFCAGTAAYFGGRWRTAVERFRAAQKIGRERCVGVTWEMNSAELLELWALAYLGDLPELSRRLPRLLKEARERDDVFAETGLLLGQPSIVWLARDLPGEADARAAAAMRRWTASGFHSQHYFALVARAQTALYRGDGGGALQILGSAWPALTTSKLLRLQTIRIELHHLRARAALSADTADRDPGPERRKLLRVATGDASRIADEDMPWAAPLASLVEAGVLARQGERAAAGAVLDRAARGFDALDMALYAAAARFQRGVVRFGVPDGHAREWMEGRGIARPAAMAGMLVPGFER